MWIEIGVGAAVGAGVGASLPLRECGLKCVCLMEILINHVVTPLAGVWIEIMQAATATLEEYRHSPCGSVD